MTSDPADIMAFKARLDAPKRAWQTYLSQSDQHKLDTTALLEAARTMSQGADHSAKFCAAGAYLQLSLDASVGFSESIQFVDQAKQELKRALNQFLHPNGPQDNDMGSIFKYTLAHDTADLFLTPRLDSPDISLITKSVSIAQQESLKIFMDLYIKQYKGVDDAFGDGSHGFITESLIRLALTKHSLVSGGDLLLLPSLPWQDAPYKGVGYDAELYKKTDPFKRKRLQIKHKKHWFKLEPPADSGVQNVYGDILVDAYNKENPRNPRLKSNILLNEIDPDLLDFISTKIIFDAKL